MATVHAMGPGKPFPGLSLPPAPLAGPPQLTPSQSPNCGSSQALDPKSILSSGCKVLLLVTSQHSGLQPLWDQLCGGQRPPMGPSQKHVVPPAAPAPAPDSVSGELYFQAPRPSRDSSLLSGLQSPSGSVGQML